MTRKEKNNYCKLTTYYDKRFKGKVTTLKVCDNLMKEKDNFLNLSSKPGEVICPYCGNILV